MIIAKNIQQWQEFRNTIRPKHQLGLVPTMGALHEGHKSLIQESIRDNNYTVVSIFVNPTQFNNSEDLDNYPSTLEKDLENLKAWGVDGVFLPTPKEIYPYDFTFFVDENNDSLGLCGQDRPGHFKGVLTVVMKLLNITKAHRAYFGEKDFQQYRLIKNMAEAFFMDVEILGVATKRDHEGLALSSRNLRLNAQELKTAQQVNKVLASPQWSLEERKQKIENLGLKIDYLEEHWGRRFIAAQIGPVRIIDNVSI